jgi:hypothetical protein
MLAPGTEMIVDGSMRRKIQQGAFFSAFGPDFDSHVDSSLTTGSVTPRITSEHRLFGLGANAIVGLDLYEATFASDRAVHRGDPRTTATISASGHRGYTGRRRSRWVAQPIWRSAGGCNAT